LEVSDGTANNVGRIGARATSGSPSRVLHHHAPTRGTQPGARDSAADVPKVRPGSAVPTGNSTASRAIEVLLVFDEVAPPVSATEVAERLGMSRATTYRYLQSLRSTGLVEEDEERGGFRLGPRILRLAKAARQGEGLVEVAQPVMRRLAEETGEAVLLTRRSGQHVVCLERQESSFPLRISFERGHVMPLHAGASAKVLLAWLKPAELATVLEGVSLDRITAETITDLAVLRKDLERSHARGWAVSWGEVDDGVVGVAAPIWRDGSRVVAGLSLVAPAHRVGEGRLEELAALLVAAARSVSERLAILDA